MKIEEIVSGMEVIVPGMELGRSTKLFDKNKYGYNRDTRGMVKKVNLRGVHVETPCEPYDGLTLKPLSKRVLIYDPEQLRNSKN